jgi:hypothetical protein
MINFYLGNHGAGVHIEDICEYIFRGLQSVGTGILYSTELFRNGGINLVMEGELHPSSDGMIYVKKRYPGTRIFLIVTEALAADGVFNSASAQPQRPDPTQPYESRARWVQRSMQFHKLLPYVDGLISAVEHIIPAYSKLGPGVHYLPLAPIPGHRPIEFLEHGKRDIDFLFTGTETPYRRKLLDALERHGHVTLCLDVATPAYLRRHFFERSKISLGMKLSESAQFMSKQRAHYHLNNRIPHIFEHTPDDSDLHEFVNFAEPGADFVETCRRCLADFESASLGKFDVYRASEKFNYTRIFQDLSNFLHQ